MTERAPRPEPGNLRRIERGVEERLRELAEAGELRGLPGEGRALAREGDGFAGDRWAAFNLMRNNKVLPAWAQLRKDIDAERERIVRRMRGHLVWLDARAAELRALPAERLLEATRATGARDARVREELDGAVAELNRVIARYNAVVPVAGLQLVPLSGQRLLEEARGGGPPA
ncbi:MAG: DnaJ family domain-containing protein [Candidatus Limnocylindria bacterium]